METHSGAPAPSEARFEQSQRSRVRLLSHERFGVLQVVERRDPVAVPVALATGARDPTTYGGVWGPGGPRCWDRGRAPVGPRLGLGGPGRVVIERAVGGGDVVAVRLAVPLDGDEALGDEQLEGEGDVRFAASDRSA